MAGIPRPGRRSSAGRVAQWKPLQKEANVSIRGYYCLFLADLQSDKDNKFPVCSPFNWARRVKKLKMTEFMTQSQRNCNTWGDKALFRWIITLKTAYKCMLLGIKLNPLNTFVSILDFVLVSVHEKYDSLTQTTYRLKLEQYISALEYTQPPDML